MQRIHNQQHFATPVTMPRWSINTRYALRTGVLSLVAVSALALFVPTMALTWPSAAARRLRRDRAVAPVTGERDAAARGFGARFRAKVDEATAVRSRIEFNPDNARQGGEASTTLHRVPLMVGTCRTRPTTSPANCGACDAAQETARAMAAALVLAVALLLSPLSAEASASGGRIGGSFPRRAEAQRLVSSSDAASSFVRVGNSRSPPLDVIPCLAEPSTDSVVASPCRQTPPTIPSDRHDNKVVLRGRTGTHLLVASTEDPSPEDLATASLFIGLVQVALLVAAMSLYELAGRLRSMFPEPQTSALGRGTSVIQVSVALHVPRRDDPSSILSTLDRLASTADTGRRTGVQGLVSDVAMELLRRKSHIVSASAASKWHPKRDAALREYSFWSTRERCKFESETVTNYGGVKSRRGLKVGSASTEGGVSSSSLEEDPPSPTPSTTTLAVVTLLLAVDGDSTRPPATMMSLASLEVALSQIVVDATVEECLRSAEVLWTPADPHETLTALGVMVDYPELRPL